MRPLITLPALLLVLATSVGHAAGSANAAQPWYIGPKGGDTRKGVTVAPPAAGPNTFTIAAATGSAPWYIGPKGGDTRKVAAGSEAGRGITVPTFASNQQTRSAITLIRMRLAGRTSHPVETVVASDVSSQVR